MMNSLVSPDRLFILTMNSNSITCNIEQIFNSKLQYKQ